MYHRAFKALFSEYRQRTQAPISVRWDPIHPRPVRERTAYRNYFTKYSLTLFIEIILIYRTIITILILHICIVIRRQINCFQRVEVMWCAV